MLNSQKVLEQMKQNAQKSAELVIADSEVQAEKVLSRANNRLVHIQGDIAELKRQRMQIEVQIRSIIESHTKLLEISEDEAKTIDVEYAKLELFKKAK
jgi:cell division initiation protein